MVEIIAVQDYSKGIRKAAEYIHSKWGSKSNYNYFLDAIRHVSPDGSGLPQFFLLMRGEAVIGCAGLIVNDFISRHDLYPWVSSLFVEEEERGHGYGNMLLEHALICAKKAGFEQAYLTTDHDGYYEKYGWKRMEDGYDLSDGMSRIYVKKASQNC